MNNAGALGKSVRILVPLASSTWAWPPGLIDSVAGRSKEIPVDYIADFHSMAWTPDGSVMALGFDTSSTMWKFQPEVH